MQNEFSSALAVKKLKLQKSKMAHRWILRRYERTIGGSKFLADKKKFSENVRAAKLFGLHSL